MVPKMAKNIDLIGIEKELKAFRRGLKRMILDIERS
jgi:hypothetical protein